jgi:hypothetical protein
VTARATFIRTLDGWRGDAGLYRLDPPFTGSALYDDYPVEGVEYVVVSSVSYDEIDEQGQAYILLTAGVEALLLPDDVKKRIALRGPGDEETKVFQSNSKGEIDVANMYEFAAVDRISHADALAGLGDGYVISTNTEPSTFSGLRVRG